MLALKQKGFWFTNYLGLRLTRNKELTSKNNEIIYEESIMARELLSEDQLRRLLNDELSKHEECKDCKFSGIMGLQEEDEICCNWSEPYLNCSGQPADICLPIANQIIAGARKKYNLR